MRYILIAALVILAGCGDLTTYYKAGASVSNTERQRLDCDARAWREAPERRVRRQEEDIWVPEKTTCDPNGTCTTERGYWERGRVYYVDENEGLRNAVRRDCMAKKGYTRETIPPCPKEVRDSVVFEPTTRFPRLTETSCVITNNDTGEWQIVSPSYE